MLRIPFFFPERPSKRKARLQKGKKNRVADPVCRRLFLQFNKKNADSFLFFLFFCLRFNCRWRPALSPPARGASSSNAARPETRRGAFNFGGSPTMERRCGHGVRWRRERGAGEVRGLQVRRRLEAREAQSSPRALPATRISPPPPPLLVIPFDQPQSAIKDSPGSMRSARHGARRSLSSRRPPADLAAPMPARAGKSNIACSSLRLHGLQATHDTPSTKTLQAVRLPPDGFSFVRVPQREMQALRMCREDLKRCSLIPRGWGKIYFKKQLGGEGEKERDGRANPFQQDIVSPRRVLIATYVAGILSGCASLSAVSGAAAAEPPAH